MLKRLVLVKVFACIELANALAQKRGFFRRERSSTPQPHLANAPAATCAKLCGIVMNLQLTRGELAWLLRVAGASAAPGLLAAPALAAETHTQTGLMQLRVRGFFQPGSEALQPFAAGLAAALAQPELVCHTRENKELRWMLHYLANGKIIQVVPNGVDAFEIEAAQDETQLAAQILKFATPPPLAKPPAMLQPLAQMTLARPENGQLGKGRVIQLLPSRGINLLVWKPALGAKSRSLPATADNLATIIREIKN